MTDIQVGSAPPDEVVACLRNARFVGHQISRIPQLLELTLDSMIASPGHL